MSKIKNNAMCDFFIVILFDDYSIMILCLVKSLNKSWDKNLAILMLLISGSIAKLLEVVKSTPLTFVLAKTTSYKSQSFNDALDKSAFVKLTSCILQDLNSLLFNFLLSNEA